MSKETFFSKIFQEFRLGSAFYGQGSQLWAFISQTFFGKNIKFLRSLDWKFPEFLLLPDYFYSQNTQFSKTIPIPR